MRSSASDNVWVVTLRVLPAQPAKFAYVPVLVSLPSCVALAQPMSETATALCAICWIRIVLTLYDIAVLPVVLLVRDPVRGFVFRQTAAIRRLQRPSNLLAEGKRKGRAMAAGAKGEQGGTKAWYG